jgi:SAM-dependent methyltransferase
LPLEDGAFTKAYSLDVLEHLSREDLLRMLGEASRILSPGGAFFVYSHVRKNSRIAIGLRAINFLARCLERIGLLDLSYERFRKSDHRNELADIDDLHRVAGQSGFRVARIRYYTPLVGGFAENILKKMAERLMERRAARRRGNSGEPSAASQGAVAARRSARVDAQRLIGNRGAVYAGLVALTWLMKLDLLLFGRIKSGPFFALLERMPVEGVDAAATRP